MLLFAVQIRRSSQVTQRARDFSDSRAGYVITGVQVAEQRMLRGTMVQRVIMPAMIKLIEFLGRFTPGNLIENVNQKLMIAGNPFNLNAQSFFGIRILMIILGGVLGLLLPSLLGTRGLRQIAGLLFFILIFILLPELWLRFMMNRRQDDIRRNLPDALDILSVCTSAGLGFNQALMRISELWRTPLGVEFARVISELDIGIPRQEALRNLAHRVDVPELSSFVAVIIQSEKLGMSISDIMTTQAEQMRLQRQYRAKEIAQKMPAKMMIPLAFFILPALLMVVLGPAVVFFTEVF
jgi:tight adherence protein C